MSTTIPFKCSAEKGTYAVSLVVFVDASRQTDHGQLGCISGMIFCELDEGSTFHVIS